MRFETVGSPLMWVGFIGLVLVLLAIDLNLFRSRALTFREALVATICWVSLAISFNVFVYFQFGAAKALEFTTGYLIEEALSVDNLFVFLIIFSYFGVSPEHQRRVLYWGILGALIMRAVFILLGTVFIQTFHWAIWVFGAILVVTGFKLLVQSGDEVHPERNPVVRLARRWIPMTSSYHGSKFFIIRDGRRHATPLLLVLVTLEATDLVFAVDSIPAVFAVTTDPFIVFTSNIFAILGLRSLYFLLASVMDRFHYLKVGLAFVLMFVGIKMIIGYWYKIPIGASLLVVAMLLGISVLASVLRPLPQTLPKPNEDFGVKSTLPVDTARLPPETTHGVSRDNGKAAEPVPVSALETRPREGGSGTQDA